MFSHCWQRLGCSQKLSTRHSVVASRTVYTPWDWMANSLESGATQAFCFRLVPSHSIVHPIKAESSPHVRVLLLLFPLEERFSALAPWVPCLGFGPSLPQEAPNFISLLAEVSAFCPTLSPNLPAPKPIYLSMFYDYGSCLEVGFC